MYAGTSMRKLRLGIVAGFGPQAAADLYLRVVREVTRRDGGAYPRIAMDNPPLTRSVERGFLRGRPTPAERRQIAALLLGSVARLRRAGVGLAALPCNTLEQEMEEACLRIGLACRNIVRATLDAVVELGCFRPVLLATTSTCSFGVYERYAPALGVRMVYPRPADQAEVTGCIERVIRGAPPAECVQSLTRVLERVPGDFDGVVLGCTDLSPLARTLAVPVPVVDSLGALALACVEALSAAGPASLEHAV